MMPTIPPDGLKKLLPRTTFMSDPCKYDERGNVTGIYAMCVHGTVAQDVVQNLSGTFPSLRELCLRAHYLSGVLDVVGVSAPTGRVSMALRKVDLRCGIFSARRFNPNKQTGLSGGMPRFCLMHSAPMLQFIDLTDNSLKGPVPWRFLPRHLVELNLSGNCFSGSVEVEHLPGLLRTFLIHRNDFSGPLIVTDRVTRNEAEWAVAGNENLRVVVDLDYFFNQGLEKRCASILPAAKQMRNDFAELPNAIEVRYGGKQYEFFAAGRDCLALLSLVQRIVACFEPSSQSELLQTMFNVAFSSNDPTRFQVLLAVVDAMDMSSLKDKNESE
jgi:hypothetical protein